MRNSVRARLMLGVATGLLMGTTGFSGQAGALEERSSTDIQAPSPPVATEPAAPEPEGRILDAIRQALAADPDAAENILTEALAAHPALADRLQVLAVQLTQAPTTAATATATTGTATAGAVAVPAGAIGAGMALAAVAASISVGQANDTPPAPAAPWFEQAAAQQPDTAHAAEIRDDARYRFINDYWLETQGERPNPYDLIGLSFAHAAGYRGEGVIVSIMDDTFQVAPNNPSTHPAFADEGKIVGLGGPMLEAYSGPYPDLSHGTHVAALVAGNSETMIGVAPEAQLFLSSSIAPDDSPTRGPGHYRLSFQDSLAVGSRVHTNSWGWDELSHPDLGQIGIPSFLIPTIAADPQGWIAAEAGTAYADYSEALVEYAALNDFPVSDYRDNPALVLEMFYHAYRLGTGERQEGFTAQDWTGFAEDMHRFQTEGNGVILFALSNYRLRDPAGTLHADTSSSLPEVFPELEGAWLAVANVNVQETPAGPVAELVSSGCHVAARYCLSHNGTAVNSAIPIDAYDQKTGTSMATPQIAGAMAILAQAFPGHTSEQLVSRVLATAYNFDDWQDIAEVDGEWWGTLRLPGGGEGEVRFTVYSADPNVDGNLSPGEIGVVDFGNGITHAYSEIFGHGFVDLRAALQPVGGVAIPIGRQLATAQRLNPLEARIALGPAFGDGLARGLAGHSMTVVDGLDGAFAVPMNQFVRSAATRTQGDALLRRFGRPAPLHTVALGHGGTLSAGFRQTGDTRLPGLAGRQETRAEIAELSFRQDMGAGAALRLEMNRDPSLAFGLHAAGTIRPDELAGRGAFTNPLLSFAQRGESFGAELAVATGTQLRFGVFQGDDGTPDGARLHGTVAELAHAFGPETAATGHFALQMALVQEERTLLDSRTGGAFDLADGTPSMSFGLSGELDLGRALGGAIDLRLVGSAHAAFSQPKPAALSLFSEVSTIESHTFSLGLLGRDLAQADDRWGLVLHQPLRVARGHADLSRAVGHDGSALRHEPLRVGLAPSGRETQAELFYGLSLAPGLDVQASALLRHQPGHVRAAPDEGIGLVRATLRF